LLPINDGRHQWKRNVNRERLFFPRVYHVCFVQRSATPYARSMTSKTGGVGPPSPPLPITNYEPFIAF